MSCLAGYSARFKKTNTEAGLCIFEFFGSPRKILLTHFPCVTFVSVFSLLVHSESRAAVQQSAKLFTAGNWSENRALSGLACYFALNAAYRRERQLHPRKVTHYLLKHHVIKLPGTPPPPWFCIFLQNLAHIAKPPRRQNPSHGAGWRSICTKILLQNFYDPKRAGGCGVAPFPSRMRFRLWVSVPSAWQGETNATKAEQCRPSSPAVNGGRYRGI